MAFKANPQRPAARGSPRRHVRSGRGCAGRSLLHRGRFPFLVVRKVCGATGRAPGAVVSRGWSWGCAGVVLGYLRPKPFSCSVGSERAHPRPVALQRAKRAPQEKDGGSNPGSQVDKGPTCSPLLLGGCVPRGSRC